MAKDAVNGPPVTPLLLRFAGRRASGIAVVLIATGAFLVGLSLAPDLVKPRDHGSYTSFFSGAAGLTAAMFIVLALEARFGTTSATLAVATVVGIGGAAIASLAALLPDLNQAQYDIAFAVSVSGGLAGLMSISLLAAGAFQESRETKRRENVAELAKRAKG